MENCCLLWKELSIRKFSRTEWNQINELKDETWRDAFHNIFSKNNKQTEHTCMECHL